MGAGVALCAVLPFGAHFLWHILNAVVLYSLVRTMMRHGMKHGADGSAAAA